MDFDWNKEKNSWLKVKRSISFEDVVDAIENEEVLDDYIHPNQERYPNQRIMVVWVNEYAYLVPYMKQRGIMFLKTVIPSRKARKTYVKQRKE